jgi:hypothetical protein
VGASVGVVERFSVSAHLESSLADLPKVWGGDFGASVLVLDSRGAIPAVTLGGRATLFTDFASPPLGLLDASAAVSWDVGAHVRPYLSCVVHFEPSARTVDPAPGLGVELRWGRGALQVEARWFAPNRDLRQSSVPWLSPFGQGAIGFVLGGRFDARQVTP